MTPHDRTDRELRDFLDWQSGRLAGAPSTLEMTERLAARLGRSPIAGPRAALRLAIVLALTALLAVAIAAAIAISRPVERLSGTVDHAILLGGVAYDPLTGATAPDPCDCDTALGVASGTVTTLGTWNDLDGKPIAWVEGWPPGAFSPAGDALFAIGGAPGVEPGPSFGTALYRIDLVTGALTLELGPDRGAETAHWTADGRLEFWQPEG